jgi:hypothetical protein
MIFAVKEAQMIRNTNVCRRRWTAGGIEATAEVEPSQVIRVSFAGSLKLLFLP